ncbi:MucBP domain-containing protein, partial [Virgibacillus oceani]
EQLTGNIGDPYEAQPKDIDGYELVEVPSNETGEFGEEPQTVTYVYTPVVEPTPGAPVDVEYVDENGNPIADPEQLTGNIGDPYEAQPKDIDGYELVEVPSNETGEFGEDPQTVTYVYTPVVEPTPGAPVDVEYVDENGNPIEDPEQLTGNIGDPYEAQPKEIDGYKLVEVPGNETGEFGEEGQTVTYVYEKMDTGSEIVNPGTGNSGTDAGQTLPDTSTNLYNLLVVGLLLIAFGTTVSLVQRRRKIS